MSSDQEALTYYNIDIYNDNATSGDISSKFQTAFNSPLLVNTSDYDVSVVRARVPLDQIPLSQDNIPFQKWQIEIGVPVVGGAPNTYNFYNAYVPQFDEVITTTSDFNIGFVDLNLQSTFLPQTEPTTTQTLSLTPNINPLAITFQGGGAGGNGVSNTAFGLIYTAFCNSAFVVSRYLTATGAFVDTVNLRTDTGRPNLIVLGITMPPNNSHVYACCYDPDTGGHHFLIDVFNNPVFLDLGIPSPEIDLYSISSSASQLTLGLEHITTSFNINYTLTAGAIATLSSFSQADARASFLDSASAYYVASFVGPTYTVATQRNITTNAIIQTYTYPGADVFDRFIGSDIYGNLLISTVNLITNVYSIRAYGKTSQILRYSITMAGSNRPLVISNMIQNTVVSINTAPYVVQTINDYLRQINLAFVAIMAQIPLPLSSPQLVPFLEFNSTTSIISIVCDAGCWSGTPAASANPACVINFNQLLWSFFKFTSIDALYTALSAIGGQVRTLEISKAIPPALSTTAQPNSTLYRFSDLTRIVIGTSRMGVYGDVENNSKLLINLGDFAVDTEKGIPNLVIYNPTILRFYKLYQTTPLTNIDIFISYANRAGEIFPVNISPYNSIGLKLLFKNRKLLNQSAL